MKKSLNVLFLVFVIAGLLGVSAFGQGQAPAGADGQRRGGGGGGRGGAGVGQRASVPPATGPMLDIANKIADAINHQDAATLQKMVAPDAVYLDEDGHQPLVSSWITKLTTGTPAKMFTISQIKGQSWDDAGWVSFNYTLAENFQGRGAPEAQSINIKGIASFVLKKPAGGDWQIQLIHGAMEQHVPGFTK